MSDLIAALQILRKYRDLTYPTNCSHDELYVCVSPEMVSAEDKSELERLSFTPDDDSEGFHSFRFGSC